MPLLLSDSRSDALPADDMTVAKVVESLRTRIVRGAIAPGSLINSVELAERCGTSRTPVREALLVLRRDGLVTLSARRRPRVAEVSVQAIRDLYALRTALHVYISEAVVQGAAEVDLRRLREQAAALVERFDARQSMEEHLRDVEGYLAAEAALAGNVLVLDVLDSLRWRIAWFRRLGMMSREQLKVLSFDRLRVAEAYLDRDARLAEALNRSMLKKAGGFCEQNFVGAAAVGMVG
jgi:DNA-binding GntR family transcriptional regulator